MQTSFDDWLRQLAAAQKGGTAATLYASRNTDFATTIVLNADYSGATLRGQIRAAPDAASLLASFTVGAATVAGGQTSFDLSIPQATLAALPGDTDGDGVEAFPYDLLLTPSGGSEELLIGGTFTLLGGITQ